MRLQVSKTKNAASLYMVESIYENGKHSNRVVEKLGTYEELKAKLGDIDPYEWAKSYVEEKTVLAKSGIEPEIIAKYNPCKLVEKNERRSYNGGYLFLQQIYRALGIHKICGEIEKRYAFEYDLDAILSRLLYGRILCPSSKLTTYAFSEELIEERRFTLHQIYRALEVIAAESKTIQAALYKNSLKVCDRNTNVLYYDCTNYYFETEEAEGLKQYGVSKEHRPNPIIQMGLFMDGNGFPLAFSIQSGNTNEQTTLCPLEQQIVRDFSLSKFVVCTDAGLSSAKNRLFNNVGNRAYVTTQSLKNLKEHLKEWALSTEGWKILDGKKQVYDIAQINEVEYENATFYKERWIHEGELEQRLIVTYSIKYRDYQRSIRNQQIERAIKAMQGNVDKQRQNDFKRFILRTSCTEDGEAAQQNLYTLNEDQINKEAAYDGFYAVCTNLEDDVSSICAINKRRWEIEESFRILKTQFKARPVYLKRDTRIVAHFLTCFLALIIYRVLEKKLGEKFTCDEIVDTLKNMSFQKIKEGYIPTYTRTDLTDALHESSGFRTDYQIITNKQMKHNIQASCH